MRKTQYRCWSCGRQFESLGDMQKHVLLVHLQKGEVAEKPRHAQAA
jgi:hypothetical protein